MHFHKRITVILFLCASKLIFAEYDIDQVKKAIHENGVNWQAEENWVTRLSENERRRLFHIDIEQLALLPENEIIIQKQSNLPSKLDWRDNDGNWLTSIKNQGECGACQIFAGLAMIESWWKIKSGDPEIDIDLSEQYILSCADVGGCDGGVIELAFEYIKEFGIPTESCMPYQENDTVPCDSKCTDWQEQTITIPEWGWITNFQDDVDLIKSALVKSPVLGWLHVYQDFFSYESGVYERTSETLMGGHAVLIIGWDDDLHCWICKNSLGSDWGENGYFRIKWGECNIGQAVSLIHEEQADSASLNFDPSQLDINIVYGQSTERQININNHGSKDIPCYITSFASGIEHMFQVSDFMAYDSLSLWMGNSGFDLYARNFISFLDLPVFDLSSSNQPVLSFKSHWSFCRSGCYTPRSIFDGFHVWISTDGGQTFNILQPTVGAYNSDSLLPIEYYFKWVNMPWHLSFESVPAWSDVQWPWLPIEFDLSPYRMSNVQLRICVISSGDDGLFVVQVVRPQLGVFIDDIQVKDGSNILFENHGENLDGMTRLAVHYNKDRDWIKIEENPLHLITGTTTSLNLNIDSRYLEQGQFKGYVGFNTNEQKDSANIYAANYHVPINLHVEAPDKDLAFQKIISAMERPAFSLDNQFGVIIKNIGRQDMNDVFVELTVKSTQSTITDTIAVPSLESQKVQKLYARPVMMRDTGDYEISAALLQPTDDVNAFNDTTSVIVNISNLINNFENDSTLWDCYGGFGITDKMNANSLPNAAHVSGGQVPYPDNMDATMTFSKPIHIGHFSHATLKYRIRGLTEPQKDVLYVETSLDSSSWSIVDSLSGAVVSWTQREIDVSNFIQSSLSKIWLRFHFISDDQTGQLGFVIDDIEIYEGVPTIVRETQYNAPRHFYLYPNYPNPFNPSTTIEFECEKLSPVSLEIFDLSGRKVKTLFQADLFSGHQAITWDATNERGHHAAAGIYIARFEAADFRQCIKLTLIK